METTRRPMFCSEREELSLSLSKQFLKCGTFADKAKLVIITATVLNALSLRENIQNVCLTYAYSFGMLYYLT